MKYVRLEKDIVVEAIPESVNEKGVAFWYGKEFAEQCVEATDDVEQHMKYDAETGTFYVPEVEVVVPVKTDAERIAELEAVIDTMLGGETA